MSFDFSAPFVAARIILPDGSLFPLWTNVGDEEAVRPSVPGTESIRALAFVQEVQVILNMSGLPQISVQLAPPFEDGMRFLDSPLADGRMRNVIEVQFGYAGGTTDGRAILSPPYRAALTAPEVTIDTEVQINLKGQGLGGMERQSGRVVAQPNEKMWDIARRLVAGPGSLRRTTEVDFSLITEAGSSSPSYQAMDAPAGDFAQGARSDWLALWEIAQRAQCDLLFGAPTSNDYVSRLIFVPRREATSAPPCGATGSTIIRVDSFRALRR